jgi:gamma-glutamylcyclotransferase (GGCT)/AIG2-like uncharacterized protein YtfP
MRLVFVYGSLKRGFHNHYMMDWAVMFNTGVTVHPYHLLNLGSFPGMTDKWQGRTDLPPVHIKGEVYQVDPALMAALDRFEGHPNFYRRRHIPVRCGGDSIFTCYAYFIQTDRMRDDCKVVGQEWNK